ncbi:MAG: AMP-binding protein, partial [Pseudorhodoplanes sp.]
MQQDFPERTIVHVLERRLADCPEKPWIVAERPWSYREMDRLSNRLAQGLLEAGIAPGDTLLVMLPNCIELVATWVACAKAGVVEVPVNTAYRGDILAHVLNDSGAYSMIVGAQYLERVRDVAKTLKSLRRCFVLGDTAGIGTGEGPQSDPFNALLASTDDPLPCTLRESDLMAVMYTSGTTGASKGVMVSHAH